jgi:environmental stress-induced protein Ves
MNLMRCDAVEPQPWRNGGGLTRELLAWPSRDDWALRISVADIRADGPFSAFPGVDRWFAVLEGNGVNLQLPEGSQRVEVNSAPLHFRGEHAPNCTLVDGPTRDLNLMVRYGNGAMRRAVPGKDFCSSAAVRALFCADPVTLRVGGGDTYALPPLTLLWSVDHAGERWRVLEAAGSQRAWWLSFAPQQNNLELG